MRKPVQIKPSCNETPMHFAPVAIEHSHHSNTIEKSGLIAISFTLLVMLGFLIASVLGFTEIRGI